MAGAPGRRDAGAALSAGGSDKHVEPKAEARGACECSAANEAANTLLLHCSARLISVASLSLLERPNGRNTGTAP